MEENREGSGGEEQEEGGTWWEGALGGRREVGGRGRARLGSFSNHWPPSVMAARFLTVWVTARPGNRRAGDMQGMSVIKNLPGFICVSCIRNIFTKKNDVRFN